MNTCSTGHPLSFMFRKRTHNRLAKHYKQTQSVSFS